jgi:hypothetical protein
VNWDETAPGYFESETICDVAAEIARGVDTFTAYVNWEGRVFDDDGTEHATLDEAKAAALERMRELVISARGEAENVICDASRWLRLNGGEP